MHPAIAALRGSEPPVSFLPSKCDFASAAATSAPSLSTYLRVVQGPKHQQTRHVLLQKGPRSPMTALMQQLTYSSLVKTIYPVLATRTTRGWATVSLCSLSGLVSLPFAVLSATQYHAQMLEMTSALWQQFVHLVNLEAPTVLATSFLMATAT